MSYSINLNISSTIILNPLFPTDNLMHSFNEHSMNPFYVPDTVLFTRGKNMKNIASDLEHFTGLVRNMLPYNLIGTVLEVQSKHSYKKDRASIQF